MTNFSNMYFICDCCSFQCQMLIITRLLLLGFYFLCEHTALGFQFCQITSIVWPASSTAILIYSSCMKALVILVNCADRYTDYKMFCNTYICFTNTAFGRKTKTFIQS